MTKELLQDLNHRLYALKIQNEISYKTIDLLKKAAKKNCSYQINKPLPGILNAIGETAWINYTKRSRNLDEMMAEINKELRG